MKNPQLKLGATVFRRHSPAIRLYCDGTYVGSVVLLSMTEP